ncbi:aromatic amino acid aminotransferase [Colletotrichum karsti]|uniref:Aromatic amino acid aminotransferase n=1 Tax=Colletotrichum karsti TaxID=1095194 RepID=A0A9P6I6W1_9PEZI|nr:aromatic amino acid aminotransferase [Colletotrichum karsti]KAF9877089.1 aromatic amino acid aminotransferase [Colletotrichum karsti]
MLLQTLASLEQARALPPTEASNLSSTRFKPHSAEPKPRAQSWGHRLEARQPSKLKAAAATLKSSDMVSLGTGRPNPQYFPWESLVAHGKSRHANGTFGEGTTPTPCSKDDHPFGLSRALNYGDAAGSDQLVRFVSEHVDLIHKPPYADCQTCLTCGTTSALDIVFRMFCKHGDSVLFESQTYPPTIEIAHAQRFTPVGVGMDGEGLVPEDLENILATWDAARGPRPFVLYMIPSGHNPTGAAQSRSRREAIYKVAEQHDLLIIEDDPYFYLQLGDPSDSGSRQDGQLSAEEYLAELPSSYLSLDRSGRVIRLDSTSKILAPGLRVGWLTASAEIVRRFLADTEISSTFPAGPSQVMMYKLLAESWGHRGFFDWLGHLSLQYSRRRDLLVEACRKHLPSDVCKWVLPTFGMFLLMQLDISKHPAAGEKGSLESGFILGTEDRIYTKSAENGTLVTKGSWFAAETDKIRDASLRLTFVAAPEDALDTAVEAFGRAVRDEFGIL